MIRLYVASEKLVKEEKDICVRHRPLRSSSLAYSTR